MKKDDLLDAIGMIDEKYIEEAENYSKVDEEPKRNQRNRKKKRFWVPLASAACLCLIIGGAWAMHGGWGLSSMDGSKDMSMEAADEASQQFENEMAKESEDQSPAGAVQEADESQFSSGVAQEDSTDPLENGDNIANEELNEGTNISDAESEDQSSIKNADKEAVSSQDDESDEQSDASQEDIDDEKIFDSSENDEKMSIWERIKAFFKRVFS